MSLPQGFLDELRARIGLAALIRRRVRLQRKGREHSGLCPFHNEKTPSFTVNEAKGFYHCFGCGAHGDAFSFIMQSEGLSFHDAVERLAGEVGLEVPKPTPEAQAAAARRSNLLDVVEAACALFERSLQADEGAEARNYLEGRGLTRQCRQRFRLGFAPDRRGFLTETLLGEGITADQLVEAGLAKRDETRDRLNEYFFGRIVFPIADRRGRIVAFGGRRMGESGPKYLNSPDGNLFHKGELLYNLKGAQEALGGPDRSLLMVEGYMDVIALAQAGFGAAVAPLGTAMTEAQLQLAWRLVDEPLLCMDGDEAGRRAASRLIEQALPLLQAGKSLEFAFLPEGEDPDSLLRSGGREALMVRLDSSLPLAELVWQAAMGPIRPATPERWAALKAKLLGIAGQIGDSGVQESYRSFLMDRFYAARRPAGTFQPAGRRGTGRGTKWREEPAPNHAKPAPESQQRRQEREFLAILLNHPQIAGHHLEELAGLEFRVAELEQFKASAIDCLAASPELDSAALHRQLTGLGYAALLDQVLSSAVYALCATARPEAPHDRVDRMLETLLADFAKTRAAEAIREAETRVAEDLNEDTLAGLEAAKRDFEAADRRLLALAMS